MPISNYVETLTTVKDSSQNKTGSNLKTNKIAATGNDVSININNFDRNSLI